jgi:hypothetical protein
LTAIAAPADPENHRARQTALLAKRLHRRGPADENLRGARDPPTLRRLRRRTPSRVPSRGSELPLGASHLSTEGRPSTAPPIHDPVSRPSIRTCTRPGPAR